MGKAVGGYFAGHPGRALGGRVGSSAGSLFAQVTGVGDYQVKRNSLMQGQIPKFRKSQHSTRISHAEYISDVVTSATAGEFSETTFKVSPGNNSTFPWLHSLTRSYEKYKIHGAIFMFKSTSGDSTGTVDTGLGTVCLATRYDVESPNFTDKRSMESHEFATSGCTTLDQLHPIECDPSLIPVDVLFTAGSENSTNRFNTPCETTIATQGHPGTSVTVGELWISYDIELMSPASVSGATSSYRMITELVPTATALNLDDYGIDPLSTLAVDILATGFLVHGTGYFHCTAYIEGSAAVPTYSQTWVAGTGTDNPSQDLFWTDSRFNTKPITSSGNYAVNSCGFYISGPTGFIFPPISTVSSGTMNIIYEITHTQRWTDYADIPIVPAITTRERKHQERKERSAREHQKEVEELRAKAHNASNGFHMVPAGVHLAYQGPGGRALP